MKRLTFVTFAVLASLALAQGDPLDPVVLDPSAWFGDVAALAAVVFAVTSLIKGKFDLHDWRSLAVSYVSGVVISVAFSLTSFYEATLWDAVVYGASAATLASGGREGVLVFLKKSFSWLTPLLPPQPVTGREHDDLPPSRKG